MNNDQPAAPPPWYRRKRSWIISGTLAVIFLATLIFLPYGIQFGLADFLRQHGASRVEISNVDFNPFSGRLLFQDVAAESAQGEVLRLHYLELDFAWGDLFSKRARVQAIDLKGLQARVDISDPARIEVNGLLFPLQGGEAQTAAEAGEETTPWGFGLDQVVLRDSELKLQQNELEIDLVLQRLSLQQVISWQLQKVAELSVEGRLNGAPLRLQLQAMPFAETRKIDAEVGLQGFDLGRLQPLLTEAGGPELKGNLELQQKLNLSLEPSGDLRWETEGVVEAGGLNLLTPQQEGAELASRWQGRVGGSLSTAGELSLDLEGELTGALQGLQLPEASLGLSAEGYRWQGQLSLEQGASGLQLQQQAELSLERITLLQHRLRARLAGLNWHGDLSLAPGEEATEISLNGAGHLDDLRLGEGEEDESLVALQQLELSDLQLTPGPELTLASLDLSGIRLDAGSVDRKTPLLDNRSLKFRHLRFGQDSGLVIGLMEQAGMTIRLTLDSSGELDLQRLLQRLQAAAQPAAADAGSAGETAPEGETMPIRIERLVLQDENRLNFTDLSVEPPFKMDLDLKKLELSNIDSSRPQQPSPFSFVGSTGRHAQIKAEGEITMFQEAPDGRFKGKLKGIEMLPLSSYTVSAIGYHLDSGELDAEIDLNLKQGDMEGNNHLVIRRLEVTQASEAEAEKLKAQIAMPLDTALGMLADKNQTIDLNLPVSGKLSDPNVELGDVINTALGNALKKGAMTYLTTALFPYGTMVALLKMAGEEAGAVRLNPVEFAPAGEALDEQDRDYLGKVAQVLKERPQIAIRLCGAATQADRQALTEALAGQAAGQQQQDQPEEDQQEQAQEDGGKQKGATQPPPQVSDEQLLALAKRRAELLEDYLVKQHGVNPSRTAVCRPQIDPDQAALPRVDLQI